MSPGGQWAPGCTVHQWIVGNLKTGSPGDEPGAHQGQMTPPPPRQPTYHAPWITGTQQGYCKIGERWFRKIKDIEQIVPLRIQSLAAQFSFHMNINNFVNAPIMYDYIVRHYFYYYYKHAFSSFKEDELLHTSFQTVFSWILKSPSVYLSNLF